MDFSKNIDKLRELREVERLMKETPMMMLRTMSYNVISDDMIDSENSRRLSKGVSIGRLSKRPSIYNAEEVNLPRRPINYNYAEDPVAFASGGTRRRKRSFK